MEKSIIKMAVKELKFGHDTLIEFGAIDSDSVFSASYNQIKTVALRIEKEMQAIYTYFGVENSDFISEWQETPDLIGEIYSDYEAVMREFSQSL